MARYIPIALVALMSPWGSIAGSDSGCFGSFESWHLDFGVGTRGAGCCALGGGSLTADGLTLYYDAWWGSPQDGENWIMKVTRANVNQSFRFEDCTQLPFGANPYAFVNVPGQRSYCPRISPDGRFLYFSDLWRSGVSGWHIWVAWKSQPDDPDAPFDVVQRVPNLDGAWFPGCVSPDGEEFYVVGQEGLMKARFNVPNDPRAGFATITELTSLNTTSSVFGPTISPDGRYLVWSDTPDWWGGADYRPCGHLRTDLWMAVRPTVDDEFIGPAINLPSPPNTTGDEYWPWLWGDGQGTVYLLSTNGSTVQAARTGCFGADPETRADFTLSQLPGEQAILDATSSTPAQGIVSYTWLLGCRNEAAGPELVLQGEGPHEVTLCITTQQGTCDYHSSIVVIPEGSPDPAFVRGDANTDGTFNIADAIFTLSHLFNAGPAAACSDAADANDDGTVDISDAVYMLQNLFAEGPAIPPPHPGCGTDPTGAADGLDCAEYQHCK